MGMLAASVLCSCSNEEEPAVDGVGKAISLSAGINDAVTRAVVSAANNEALDVTFARIDKPETTTKWNALNAVRTAGKDNTPINFTPAQTYSGASNTYMVGLYPQLKASVPTGNPATVSYTITGDQDVMATKIQEGSAASPFEAFTFNHLLTQLQFKCVGSTEAKTAWGSIKSIKVKQVPTKLDLTLDKEQLEAVPALSVNDAPATADLSVLSCPKAIVTPDDEEVAPGYLMLYPVAKMGGTVDDAITLEILTTYDGDGSSKMDSPREIKIDNIDGGVKAGYSHLITLTFSQTGEITFEAGIAEWLPGNGGSSTVKP